MTTPSEREPIASLRAHVENLAKRFEKCLIASGTDPEYAALAVSAARQALAATAQPAAAEPSTIEPSEVEAMIAARSASIRAHRKVSDAASPPHLRVGEHGHVLWAAGEEEAGMLAALTASRAWQAEHGMVVVKCTPSSEMEVAGLVALVKEIERIWGPPPAVTKEQMEGSEPISDEIAARRYMYTGAIMRCGTEIREVYRAMITQSAAEEAK